MSFLVGPNAWNPALPAKEVSEGSLSSHPRLKKLVLFIMHIFLFVGELIICLKGHAARMNSAWTD